MPVIFAVAGLILAAVFVMPAYTMRQSGRVVVASLLLLIAGALAGAAFLQPL